MPELIHQLLSTATMNAGMLHGNIRTTGMRKNIKRALSAITLSPINNSSSKHNYKSSLLLTCYHFVSKLKRNYYLKSRMLRKLTVLLGEKYKHQFDFV
jgi:hypothetical protein